jgi:hypothetical protein
MGVGIDDRERALFGKRHGRQIGDILVLLLPFSLGFGRALNALSDVVAAFRDHPLARTHPPSSR